MRPVSTATLAAGALCIALHGALGVSGAMGASTARDDFSVASTMAERARAACALKGYAVTVTVVGLDGQAMVLLRSDHAPIHTIQNSFNKAYTIMTLGALMGADTMTALNALYRDQSAKSYGLAPEPLPHISFAPGSVLIRSEGRVLGGLGVSGSRSGDIDESCAKEGAGVAP